jgi:hypothetical protein
MNGSFGAMDSFLIGNGCSHIVVKDNYTLNQSSSNGAFSGVVPTIAPAATINIGRSHVVLLSSSATAIKTIASLLAPGEQVTFLIASGSATFNTGGNIALGNLSSIVLNGPGTVSFVYSDTGNSWNVVGPSPVREVTYDLANQSVGIGTTSIYTIAANATGMYRISGSLVTTTAGTGGTVSVTLGNNNGSALSTQGPLGITQLNTLGWEASFIVTVCCAAGTNITYTTVSSGTGSPKYALHLRVEALG